MSRTLTIVLMLILCCAFCASAVVRRVVKVPLEYNYLPGEPFWAKYGSIDQRGIELWIGSSPIEVLGNFVIEGTDDYILVPHGSIGKYLDKAVSSVLSHYGINIRKTGKYRLVVTPLVMNISAIDDDEDEEKLCRVKLRIEYYGPDGSRLFLALAENEGVMETHNDDELEYADLLDRTLHGAIVKIWGSRALFTDKPLGGGIMKKLDRGTYAFVPDSFVVSSDTSVTSGGAEYRPSQFHRSAAVRTGAVLPEGFAENATGGSVITGAYGDDTVVVAGGRRISVGILPFENGTGSERMTAPVKSAQERFSTTLSRSGTVKIMERGKLTDILREQALGLSGIMNDSTVVKVGNISGLQVMIAGDVTQSGSYYRLNARIINVETSAIVASASLLVPDELQISEAGADLAAQLLYKFTEEKLDINRNTMPYPLTAPRAQPAVTAATEDAWAVECNPASLMKVSQRDAAFHLTFAEKLSATAPDGGKVATVQPPYARYGP